VSMIEMNDQQYQAKARKAISTEIAEIDSSSEFVNTLWTENKRLTTRVKTLGMLHVVTKNEVQEKDDENKRLKKKLALSGRTEISEGVTLKTVAPESLCKSQLRSELVKVVGRQNEPDQSAESQDARTDFLRDSNQIVKPSSEILEEDDRANNALESKNADSYRQTRFRKVAVETASRAHVENVGLRVELDRFKREFEKRGNATYFAGFYAKFLVEQLAKFNSCEEMRRIQTVYASIHQEQMEEARASSKICMSMINCVVGTEEDDFVQGAGDSQLECMMCGGIGHTHIQCGWKSERETGDGGMKEDDFSEI
jgi:hypothetical protein